MVLGEIRRKPPLIKQIKKIKEYKIKFKLFMLKKVFESLEWAEKPLVVLGALVAAKWVVKKLSNLSFFCS